MTDIITRATLEFRANRKFRYAAESEGDADVRAMKAALRTLLDDEAVKGLVWALAASCTALKDTAWVETHNDGKKALTAFQQLQQQLTREPK